jgi:hypothetical protein
MLLVVWWIQLQSHCVFCTEDDQQMTPFDIAACNLDEDEDEVVVLEREVYKVAQAQSTC